MFDGSKNVIEKRLEDFENLLVEAGTKEIEKRLRNLQEDRVVAQGGLSQTWG